MTFVDEYASTARQVQGTWADATEAWASSAQKAVGQLPVQYQAPYAVWWPGDAVIGVDQWFDFAGRVLDANRAYARNLTGVAHAFGGAVREHVDSLGAAVLDLLQAVGDAASEQAQKI
jgi:hypothetical protein